MSKFQQLFISDNKKELRAIGNESYEDRFSAFLKHTNQKVLTSKILENLFKQISEKTGLFNRDTLKIDDVGCGEGTLAKQVMQLLNSQYKGSLEYTGLDCNENFVENFKKELSQFQDVKLEAYQVDVFEDQKFPVADIVLASHMIYHSYTPSDKVGSEEKANTFIKNIVNALSKDSIAIAIHEAENSDMREIATKYGSGLMPNAPGRINAICKEGKISVIEIPFEAKLTFPKLKNQWWISLKNKLELPKAQYIPEMKEALHLLGFIIQRNFNEMEEKEFEGFVSDVHNRLDNNNALTIRSTIQVMLSQECSTGFENSIAKCCQKTEQEIPSIQKELSEVLFK